MSHGKYFNYLPTVPYETFDGSTRYKVVTDIFKRVRATLEARTDKTIYYKYRVTEGQKPEHVAYNYYGDAKYHWVVLLMNEIRDPQWCWPMDSFTFERYIINKYGSTDQAQAEVSHYETKELRAPVSDDNYNLNDVVLKSGMLANSTFAYSYTTIVDGTPGTEYSFGTGLAKTPIYAFTNEVTQNEKRADIVLLRRNMLQEFVNDFESLVVQKR